MEEDLSTKAPVTRLRRRLSVEPKEESKSPAPSTPTKKRGVRTAKPQLELIEENVAEKITPRRATRRSITRDTVEEEKPLTPSRRSTRIRSNTSLVLETTQSLDSPRSKRATRRNSQVGSDNEAPTTPARTRKTRKDSVTVEKPGDTTIITESISEEPEINISQSKSLKTPETSRETNISPNSQRKSTRLLAKQSPVISSDSNLNDSINNKAYESEIENNNKATKNKKRASNTHEESVQSEDKENKTNLSLSSRNLIDNLEAKSPKVTNNLNNSIASIQKTSLINSKRNRTKSWTIISGSPANETTFFSDSESAKKKVKGKLNSSKISSEGDSLNKSGNKNIEAILNSSKSKNRHSIKSSQADELKLNGSDAQKSEIENLELVDTKKSNKILETSQVESIDTKKLFEKPPILLESKVFIEDSDSNVEADQLIGDQCVPNVNHVYVNNSPNLIANEISNEDQVDPTTKIKANQSIEPMDIDETMPENVVLNDSDQLDSSIDSTTKSKRKSSLMDEPSSELKRSRRKSSISKVSGKDDNKSINEVKEQLLSPTKIDGEDNNEDKHSKRKSTSFSLTEKSITETTANNTSLNVSKRKSSSSVSLIEEINNSTSERKSKQKLLLSESCSENNDKSTNVSKRKSNSTADITEVVTVSSKDVTDVVDDGSDGVNKSLNKSKLKSNSNSIIENTSIGQNKSVDKSKIKSSLMQSNLEDSIKSNNENKSTLLLSQINDGSHTPKTFKKNESLNITTEEQKLKNKHLATISTSTPLLDKTSSKAIKKHGDVNISDIIAKEKKINETNKSILKDISQNSSEEESTDDDESSEAGSGLIIDEAEEASDDYESGDSQDEDEKQYVKENEIGERGETLTSDEDISNDSDYEKDSFIVSSDEEDNDLLDGSGDDLSMSDKELSMSKKSKKKYNERKLAEQKQASREMYNSRHKINTPNKDTSKSKSKSKLDSLLLESDDDADKSKLKKSKRLRLDSSHETSAINSDANESIIGKKKKAKRLSESVMENTDEKEITVCADNMTDIDPLVNNIKQEPKSARQSLNISTIPFNCVDDVENVQIDENATIINSNELEDPLADDDSESSDNEEIIDNYEILLNNLNKKSNKKTVDTSLNIDRKSNKQVKEPIVEQLNLSVTKQSKKKKSDVSKDSNLKNSLKISMIEQEEASSDSIDMKLLFAEDSNDSEDKPKIDEYGGEDFISIKQTQTDLQNKDKQQDMDISLNTSVKSKKNKKHSLSEESVSSNYKLEKLLNVSLNVSGIKQNLSVVEAVTSVNANTPLNKSLNTSIKKKNKSLSEDASEVTPNTSITASGKKKKHNKSISEEITETPDLDTSKDNVNKSLNQNRNNSLSEDGNASKSNTSLTASGKKKEKKQNKSVTDGLPELPALDDANQQNESLNTSVKNKKSKKLSISEETSTTKDETDSAKVVDIDANKNDDDDMPEEVPYKSEKNNDVNTESHQVTGETQQTSGKKKRNRKKKKNTNQQETQSGDNAPTEQKESDHTKENPSLPIDADDDDMPEEVPYKSEKNNDVNTESHQDTGETQQTSGKKKRNRKKKKNTNQQETQSGDNAPTEQKESDHTKENPSLPIDAVPDNAQESEGKKSKKRKRKLTSASSAENTNDEERKVNLSIKEPSVPRSKNKKQKVSEATAPVTIPAHKPTETIIQKENKNKKRKKREEDDTEPEVTKVQKRNSSNKGIPRLPSDVISQLTEKPKKDLINAKRAKIIATTDFEVKETRRTKGVINEGIETVFLNGETSDKKKLFNKYKHKLVPFAPVLATSGFGFTTNFQVSLIPKETKFVAVAKPAEISNFKHDYLAKKLKKLTTDHMSRRPRSARLSKF